MKVLITGGAGFIGSHIAEHYQGIAEEVRVLDNLRTGYKKNLDGLNVTFIEGSILLPFNRYHTTYAISGIKSNKYDISAKNIFNTY